MQKPCPICRTHFEEAELPAHMADAHAASTESAIPSERSGPVRCFLCGTGVASPEALRDHIGAVHHL